MRNKFEDDIYKQLVRRYGKENVEYEPHSFDYAIYYSYLPDFRVLIPNEFDEARSYYIETKGYFRQKDRRTIKAVREQNPSIDLRMIFQQNNKLDKYAKSKYSDWAERNGIEYSISRVPRNW